MLHSVCKFVFVCLCGYNNRLWMTETIQSMHKTEFLFFCLLADTMISLTLSRHCKESKKKYPSFYRMFSERIIKNDIVIANWMGTMVVCAEHTGPCHTQLYYSHHQNRKLFCLETEASLLASIFCGSYCRAVCGEGFQPATSVQTPLSLPAQCLHMKSPQRGLFNGNDNLILESYWQSVTPKYEN